MTVLSGITLLSDCAEQRARLEAIAAAFAIPCSLPEQALFALEYQQDRLQLRKLDEPKTGPVWVEFVSGALAHRRKFGGGRGQAIAKAIGLKSGKSPSVVDATAGLGRDAFVLASLGCRVTLIERHPVVAALLEDGLRRAEENAVIGPWIQDRMSLQWGAAPTLLGQLAERPDVVYLDPMFPHRAKSALVKKEMRVFQHLVGADPDADALLPAALQAARARVVVKRPDYAGFLNQQPPTLSLDTKKNRFDIYVNAAI